MLWRYLAAKKAGDTVVEVGVNMVNYGTIMPESMVDSMDRRRAAI